MSNTSAGYRWRIVQHQGDLATACTCEAFAVAVPAPDVRRGVTRSCGRPWCDGELGRRLFGLGDARGGVRGLKYRRRQAA